MHNQVMRLTIEVDEKVLNELLRLMGEKKKSPAVSKAVVDWVRRRKAREFGRLLREGRFDYPVTNEELERQDL